MKSIRVSLLLPIMAGVLLLNNCILFEEGGMSEGVTSNRFSDLNLKIDSGPEQQRSIVLDNKLEVLLISNPEFNKSAAALNVAVGSLGDPKDALGLAHFLEHMLFLGTEKYPDESEYRSYLDSYQGHSNAYTSSESTNYYFEIAHDGFNGAVDRFADFFRAPLFNFDYVKREVNAVNSEYQNNLKHDGWRHYRASQLTYKQDHPASRFTIGNLETLANVDRDVLLDFYKAHYSSNKMKLVLQSTLSLDAMESLAKEHFTAIKNYDLKPLQYESELHAAGTLPKMLHIKPIKDIRDLDMAFTAPSDHSYWKTKPTRAISHLLGHEGAGSLLAWLKKKHWATGLSSGFETETYIGQLEVKISLTKEGMKHVDTIVERFFSYVNMLSATGFKKYLYEEMEIVERIRLAYREHKEGGQVASHRAAQMQFFDADQLDQQTRLFHEYNPEHFNKFLSYIRPDNMVATLTAHELATDTEEKFFGVQYKNVPISNAQLTQWKNPQKVDDLFIPEVNPYIPTSLALLPQRNEEPKVIVDTPLSKVWYQKDDKFKKPRGRISIDIKSPAANSSPLEKVHALFYVMVLNEALNEWNYQLQLAGLNYSLSRYDEGMHLQVSGFSDNMLPMLTDLSKKLTSVEVDAETFQVLKNDFIRGLENRLHDQAYRQMLYSLNHLLKKNDVHFNDYYDPENKVDLISNVTLADVQKFSKEFFKQTYLEVAVYGNLDREAVKSSIEDFSKELQATPLAKENRPQEEILQPKVGEAYAYTLNVQNNNNCFGARMLFGERTPQLDAVLRIAASKLKGDFFDELRTRQALGYIVHSDVSNYDHVLGLLFLVQSAEYDLADIDKRVEGWYSRAEKMIKDMDQKEFDLIKSTVVSEMLEEDKTIGEAHGTLATEAFKLGGVFGYDKTVADAAQALSKSEFEAAFLGGFDAAKRRSISVYAFKNGSKLYPIPEKIQVSEPKSFKQSLPVF